MPVLVPTSPNLSASQPPGQAFAIRRSPSSRPRARRPRSSAALGAVIAFVDVALAFGAFVLGVAADAWGDRAVFAAGAGSAVVGLAVLGSMRVSRPLADR